MIDKDTQPDLQFAWQLIANIRKEGENMAIKMTRRELAQPIKCTCGNCGGEAWIMPIPLPQGNCLCGKCTFGEAGLTLPDMLKRLYCK